MIIAVDIGNTNIVFGIFNNDNLEFIERISTDHNITSLEYFFKFQNILSLHSIEVKDIKGSIISSVVPNVSNITSLALKRLTGKEPLLIGKNVKTDLNIDIDNRATLGSDLIVDAVAAIDEYSVPAAVIDMGTATTISVIDKDKKYIGGVILPGINISLEALTSRTSQLPKISLEAPESIIAKNTIDCMKSGMIFGTASQIDGMIERIEEEIGEKVTAIATGGIANVVIPYCHKEIIIDDALLLKGLLIIYKKNKNI